MWSITHPMRSKTIAAAVLGAALALGNASPASATGTLDDWWLCVETCGDEDAACVDACTEKYNESHVADPIRTFKLKTAPEKSGPTPFRNSFELVARCPAGSVLTPFDMPIYDESGLFVVDLETVWVCVPADLEPAG